MAPKISTYQNADNTHLDNTKSAPLKLSRLRDIGWSKWDPIGLLLEGQVWGDQPFSGEYDSYLSEAAGRLRRDWSVQDTVLYLMQIERDHMGLGERPDSHSRAQSTAEAIRSYLNGIDAP